MTKISDAEDFWDEQSTEQRLAWTMNPGHVEGGIDIDAFALADAYAAHVTVAKDTEITRLTAEIAELNEERHEWKREEDSWKHSAIKQQAKLKQIRELIGRERDCHGTYTVPWITLDDLLRALDAMETK